jgi:hypothetical protein
MIRNSKQAWEIGQLVNVGFLKNLLVVEKVATPGDHRPDLYVLANAKGAVYSFIPHNGIARHDSIDEARRAW